MQYQNPLEPMTDTAFVAQLAQFNSLQQMETLNTTMGNYQAYSLTGKYGYAEIKLDTGEEVAVEGNIDRVLMKDGKMYAQIGDYLVETSKISEIWDKDLLAASGNNLLLENANLVGKYLEATTYDGQGNKTGTASGLCTRVAIEDKMLCAFFEDGTKVGIGDITNISSEPIGSAGETESAEE
jgi:hypothetical protein